MADVYGRLSGTAGVCLGTLDPGELIREAEAPIVLVGNGVARVGCAPALRRFVETTGIPAAETFMGKGAMPADDPKWLGSVGLQSGDYEMAGFAEADVVITVGFDLVEHSPEHWNPDRDKRIVCIDTASVEVDEYFMTEVDLIGDMEYILDALTEQLGELDHDGGSTRLRDVVQSHFESAKDNDNFPVQ